MTTQAFQPLGTTFFLSANASGAQTALTTSGTADLLYLKIDNTNNANVDAFINFGTANTTTATIANATASGNSFIVQHNDTIYIQTGSAYNQDPSGTLYVAAITTTGTANLYITPVALVS